MCFQLNINTFISHRKPSPCKTKYVKLFTATVLNNYPVICEDRFKNI